MHQKLVFTLTEHEAILQFLPCVYKAPLLLINKKREIVIQGHRIGIISENGEVIFKALSASTES